MSGSYGLACENMDGLRDVSQVVQVDIVVCGADSKLVRAGWIVFHAAHVRSQIYCRGWRTLLC